MIDSEVLQAVFGPYQRQLALAAHRGLSRVNQLISVSLRESRERPGEVMNLMTAEDRTVTLMRRDEVCAELRALLDGEKAVDFRREWSWQNALFDQGEYMIRMRIKAFRGEDGEQHMAATQLQFDVGGDPALHDVTLGWAETDEGLLPYLVHVDHKGQPTWRMSLPKPASTAETTTRTLPGGVPAEAPEPVRRVRPAASRTAAARNHDDEVSDSA